MAIDPPTRQNNHGRIEVVLPDASCSAGMGAADSSLAMTSIRRAWVIMVVSICIGRGWDCITLRDSWARHDNGNGRVVRSLSNAVKCDAASRIALKLVNDQIPLRAPPASSAC